MDKKHRNGELDKVQTFNFQLQLSSNPLNGANNINQLGSSFDIDLPQPLYIPAGAIQANLEVRQATIWFTIPNVTNGINSNFSCTGFESDGKTLNTFNISLPTGLYSLDNINTQVNFSLSQQAAYFGSNGDTPLLTFVPDNATGKVVLNQNYTNVAVTFPATSSGSLGVLLGFQNAGDGLLAIAAPATAPYSYPALYGANFNTYDYLVIHSDLVTDGIRINNTYDQSMCFIYFTVQPGQQQVFEPFRPSTISINELINQRRSKIRVWLTDNNGNLVNTNGEYFSCLINISYTYRS